MSWHLYWGEIDSVISLILQVDSKPAGQPEHASLNQCQLIAPYKPKIGV